MLRYLISDKITKDTKIIARMCEKAYKAEQFHAVDSTRFPQNCPEMITYLLDCKSGDDAGC